MPEGSWGWREALLLLALTTAPIATVLALVPETRSLSVAADVTALVSGVVLFVASLQLYLFWRMAPHLRAGWLVAASVFGSGQVMVDSGLRFVNADGFDERPGWLLLTELGVALGVLAMVVCAGFRVSLPDPMALGLTLGLVAGGAQVLVSWFATPLELSTPALSVLLVLVCGTWIGIGVVGLRVHSVPMWVRVRIVAVVTLIAIVHATDSPISPGGWTEMLTILAVLGAALLMASASSALLRHGLRGQAESYARMQGRLDEVEASVRLDRERMHEIRSTIAGISTASRLLSDHGDDLDERRRDRLRRTLDSEMARLVRLLDDRIPVGPGPVDLDEAIDPVLESHRARGHRVEWKPSGLTVRGRADDVAEVLNILLENAAAHGDASSTIAVSDEEGVVTIAVSDSGPGIPEDVRDRIFDWGVRGADSSGQGIGLHVARRLVSEQGGSLTVAGPGEAGTSFIIRLPAVRRSEENHDADTNDAH
jgi:signal transduction histidine kinase